MILHEIALLFLHQTFTSQYIMQRLSIFCILFQVFFYLLPIADLFVIKPINIFSCFIFISLFYHWLALLGQGEFLIYLLSNPLCIAFYLTALSNACHYHVTDIEAEWNISLWVHRFLFIREREAEIRSVLCPFNSSFTL